MDNYWLMKSEHCAFPNLKFRRLFIKMIISNVLKRTGVFFFFSQKLFNALAKKDVGWRMKSEEAT